MSTNKAVSTTLIAFLLVSWGCSEEEEQIFFEDRSGLIISDDVFARLLTFPNVIITDHQAFFTREALTNIAATTIDNVTRFEQGQTLGNQLAG